MKLILDCNIPIFKLKYQQFKNGQAKLDSETVFLLFFNKRGKFLGIGLSPESTFILPIFLNGQCFTALLRSRFYSIMFVIIN